MQTLKTEIMKKDLQVEAYNENAMLEMNRLIAEFMGELDQDTGEYSHLGEWFFPEDCKFHTSWDWLMPVVEKITQQTKEFKEGHIDSCLYTPLASALIRFTDKELVYEAVIEFIKWYNEQTNK